MSAASGFPTLQDLAIGPAVAVDHGTWLRCLGRGRRHCERSVTSTHKQIAAIASAPLPDVTTTIIQPTRGFAGFDLRSVWEYRELVYFLVWKELKTRYQQTALGVAWAILQPFLTMVIFTVIFSYLARIPSGNVPYPLFVYSALVPWTYFSQAIVRGGQGLVGNANLISKVYFPRVIIPLVAATTPVVDLVLALVFLFAMLAWYQVVPPLAVLLLPAFVLMAFAAAISIGFWLSALNVRYRDIGHLIPFLVQFGLLGSPVAYPVSLVPVQWQGLYALNPMVAVIEGFRWCLLDAPAPTAAMIAFGLLTVALLLVTGFWYFRATERTFADLI
jgi:homopolymeric O-antigen transport system permease protein